MKLVSVERSHNKDKKYVAKFDLANKISRKDLIYNIINILIL
jgi:hypothetical protein